MGGVLPTESNISMTGAGLVGKSTSGAGKSARMAAGDVRSLCSVYSTSEVDTLLATHTHTTADITGFGEAVDDEVASLLVAGTNITLTYNDAANTLTIAASGGSPGGSSGQVLFNNAGSFGGAAAVVYAATGTHLVVTAQGSTVVPLCLKGAASHTALMLDVQTSAGTSKLNITQNGKIRSNVAVVSGAGAVGADGCALEMAFNGYGVSANAKGETAIVVNGTVRVRLGIVVVVGSAGGFGFGNLNHAGQNSTVDVQIGRNAAGVIEINSGTAGTFRDLIVRNLRMSAPTLVPASASATGSEGQIAWDDSYIYVCTATNTWKRVAIATW